MQKDINIFNYSNYREYLTIWLQEAKNNKSFNLSRLADVAQIHPTYLSHILAGTKHLSLEQAALISEHLEHTKLEQDYFFILINLDRAGNKKLKDYWLEKKSLLEKEKNKLSQRFEKHKQLNQEQRAIFYSSWIYVAVWATTAINNRQSLSQIAERFDITKDRTEEVLTFLLETGLCTEKNGLYSMGEVHVHIPNESPLVVKHHTNWRIKAIQEMDSRTDNELFFSAPMSISLEDYKKIRERINKLITNVVDIAKGSKAEDLACLNIDFFKPT